MSTIGHNCWSGEFCPLWCGCQNPQPTTCEDLNDNFGAVDFVMNENWFDGFCEGRMYSMLIPEPVSRAVSHVNHFLDAVAARGHEHFQDTKGWRLSLAQSNYMTWSLTARSHDTPRFFRPRAGDLTLAKESLRQMDFLIDLSFPNATCTKSILQLMGITSQPLDTTNSYETDYQVAFDKKLYETVNSLDVALYEYATSLVTVDCAFFVELIRKYPSAIGYSGR